MVTKSHSNGYSMVINDYDFPLAHDQLMVEDYRRSSLVVFKETNDN